MMSRLRYRFTRQSCIDIVRHGTVDETENRQIFHKGKATPWSSSGGGSLSVVTALGVLCPENPYQYVYNKDVVSNPVTAFVEDPKSFGKVYCPWAWYLKFPCGVDLLVSGETIVYPLCGVLIGEMEESIEPGGVARVRVIWNEQIGFDPETPVYVDESAEEGAEIDIIGNYIDLDGVVDADVEGSESSGTDSDIIPRIYPVNSIYAYCSVLVEGCIPVGSIVAVSFAQEYDAPGFSVPQWEIISAECAEEDVIANQSVDSNWSQ